MLNKLWGRAETKREKLLHPDQERPDNRCAAW